MIILLATLVIISQKKYILYIFNMFMHINVFQLMSAAVTRVKTVPHVMMALTAIHVTVYLVT